MNLVIISDLGKLSPQFIDYIFSYYRSQCYTIAINKKISQRIDTYLSEIPDFAGLSSLQILRYALTHLVCDCENNVYTIHVDYNVKLPTTNKSLYSICKLFEFGNLNIGALNLFSETSRIITANLEGLMRICQLQFPIVITEDE